MYMRTMCFSRQRERTGVMDIGLKSLGCVRLVTFDTGVITAVLHCCGTMPSDIDWLKSCVSGAAKIAAPSRKN